MRRRVATIGLSFVLSLTVALSFLPAQALALNSYEKQISIQTNKERAKVGQTALKAQECIDGYAERHAKWLVKTGKFQHQSMGKLIKACKLRSVGENIAKGGFPSGWRVVNAWMASPGHRANILTPGFTRLGVGAKGKGNKRVFVQIFGTPR